MADFQQTLARSVQAKDAALRASEDTAATT
jgi:hypothetical protein